MEKIKEPHKSYPRNKLIAQVLYLAAYLERWGTGIERIVQMCREYNVPEPVWSVSEHDVTVIFWRNSKEGPRRRLGRLQESGENFLKS